MFTGTIKFFQKAKGFGFITPDEGTIEVFLPASVITIADAPKLIPGQRVAYEQTPDTKGPKVVTLKLLEEIPRAPTARPPQIKLTIFYDPSLPASDEVLQELKTLGYEVRLVDYITAPPGPDELKKLSLMLGGSNFGLVRRHDTLFMGLQLDDRFIAESDFWTAISQHPTLINGPVLVTVGSAGICKTCDDVRAFFGVGQPKKNNKPKGIPARLASLMAGNTLSTPPMTVDQDESQPSKSSVAVKVPKTLPKPKKFSPTPIPKPKTKTTKQSKSKLAKAVKKVTSKKS